jgi:hypothetical protein
VALVLHLWACDERNEDQTMRKKTSEDDKKHGDPLEPLIGRTMGGSSPRKREQPANDDDRAQLQDDDDEDVQNDDPENGRDVGERS